MPSATCTFAKLIVKICKDDARAGMRWYVISYNKCDYQWRLLTRNPKLKSRKQIYGHCRVIDCSSKCKCFFTSPRCDFCSKFNLFFLSFPWKVQFREAIKIQMEMEISLLNLLLFELFQGLNRKQFPERSMQLTRSIELGQIFIRFSVWLPLLRNRERAICFCSISAQSEDYAILGTIC